MACDGITGQGIALTLSVDTTLGKLRSLQLPEWVSEAVDFSHLETTGFMCFKAGDLTDGGEFVAEIVFNPEIAQPTQNVEQTATITFPLNDPVNTTPATFTGTGFITNQGWPNAAINEPMIATITFKFDGDTGPAFTLEAP